MSRNIAIACSFLIILIVWMLTGLFSCKQKSQAKANTVENNLFTVRAKNVNPELVEKEIILNGKTVPNRRVTVRAEIESKVLSIGAKRGDFVKEGEVIITLDEKDLRFRLQEAEALLQQRTLEYKAAENLFGKQMLSEMKVAEAKAALEHANAVLAKARLDLKNTQITAPFSGMLQSRSVVIGDYVHVGQPIAEILEIDPLTILAQVSERFIHNIHVGMPGKGKLASGQEVEGTVTYISPEAGSKCRTFTVELDVPNPDNKISAGETVQLILATEPLPAYQVPISALVLDDEGVLGVKVLDDQNVVHFIPAKIIKSTNTGTWLTGLPQKSRVIVIGQHYVLDNEHVTVDEQKDNQTHSVEILEE